MSQKVLKVSDHERLLARIDRLRTFVSGGYPPVIILKEFISVLISVIGIYGKDELVRCLEIRQLETVRRSKGLCMGCGRRSSKNTFCNKCAADAKKVFQSLDVHGSVM